MHSEYIFRYKFKKYLLSDIKNKDFVKILNKMGN